MDKSLSFIPRLRRFRRSLAASLDVEGERISDATRRTSRSLRRLARSIASSLDATKDYLEDDPVGAFPEGAKSGSDFTQGDEGEAPALPDILPSSPKFDSQNSEVPSNPSWLLAKAVRAFYGGHYAIARWLSQIEYLLNPKDYFSICWYANCLHFSSSKNDHESVALYQRAIEISPLWPLAHAGLGRIHYSMGKRSLLEHLLYEGTSVSYADSQCANRNMAIQELEEAASLASGGDDEVTLLNMAAEVHGIKNKEAGIKAYRKVLKIAPDYGPAHVGLADCYAAIGCRKLALRQYEFIRENAPDLVSDVAKVFAYYGIELDEREASLMLG